MGRLAMYLTIAALALFVASAMMVLDLGGQSRAAVSNTSVHDLLLIPSEYTGKTVTTDGVIRDSGHEYFIVDSEGQGIFLQYDEAVLDSYKGRNVRVTGEFNFERGAGVYIDVDVIRPLDR
jgi:hypothetical protein